MRNTVDASFLGLTRDVEAHTGMMIALEGYTPAAINRAFYDDLDVILDVLNLDELKAFQGRAAIPYAGENGVSIAAPFGWIVDATRRPNTLAVLYQRGLTFEEAQRNGEWMYINLWNKQDPEVSTLDALLTYQESYLLQDSPDAEIQVLQSMSNQRTGAKTRVRRFKKKTWIGSEYTGFVDFDNFIFMCVLFTPGQLERKNLRKLHFMLRDAFPLIITRDNTSVIAEAKKKLETPIPSEERAHLLSQLGWWYRDMNRFDEARQFFEESLSIVPNNYDTISNCSQH